MKAGLRGPTRWWKGPVAAIVVVAGLAAVQTVSAQETLTTSRRLTRELSIMEKVIDQMLLDSRNFLVYSSEDNTRGLYLEEFGVLFSFQGSLLERNKDFNFDWNEFDVKEKDGVIVISPPKDQEGNKRNSKVDRNKNRNKDDDEDAEDGEDEEDEEDEIPDLKFLKKWRTRNSETQQRLYTNGKNEIVDVLLDYGDSMSSLRDAQWLGIAAFLKGSDFFSDRRISRLVIKARMSDLRAYGDHKIDLETMKKRVVEEEY